MDPPENEDPPAEEILDKLRKDRLADQVAIREWNAQGSIWNFCESIEPGQANDDKPSSH
jgi:hypothetical protein